MIAFLTILYVAAIILVFKILKVKPAPWPIAAFVVAGILLIGGVTVLWTLAAPISNRAVVTRYVVQLVPYVKGQVTSIPAKPNAPLRKGDVLYTVDTAPYEYELKQVDAQLAAARSNVIQSKAALDVAQANIAKVTADMELAKSAFQIASAINAQNAQAISKLKLVEAEQQYAASQATVTQAKASESQAVAALEAAKDSVASVEAQRETAQFNLKQCTVTAPMDGIITDWAIREGTYVVPMPMAAAGTFIDTTDTVIVAPFPAQMLVHVKPGQPVEIAFKSRPGLLFRGTVENVIQATGEGQVTPGGKLPSAAAVGSPGVLAVKIRLNNDEPADELEMGAAGAVTIYTDWGKPFHMISKVAIRMQKWAYFLPLP